jgi:pSer/pThr/pTyr-binding forkhead associated (FHA) protein
MASILVTKGVLEGQYLRLPDERIVSIGRDDQCTLQLLDRSVSRKHLQIRLDEASGERIASDYRSANGVVINGNRISGDVTLHDGDQITLGQLTMVYLADDHPDAKSALNAARRKSEWKRSTLMRGE